MTFGPGDERPQPEPQPAVWPGGQDADTGDGPPLEAYSRVTDPERYARLHDAAAALLRELGAGYDVQISATTGERGPVVALTPAAGAPLTVEYTDFPGLLVRFGRWHEVAYPACGCDACNEDPAELDEMLTGAVRSVVDGTFVEERRREGTTVWLNYEIGESSGGRGLEPGDPAGGEPVRIVWPGWPRRSS